MTGRTVNGMEQLTLLLAHHVVLSSELARLKNTEWFQPGGGIEDELRKIEVDIKRLLAQTETGESGGGH